MQSGTRSRDRTMSTVRTGTRARTRAKTRARKRTVTKLGQGLYRDILELSTTNLYTVRYIQKVGRTG